MAVIKTVIGVVRGPKGDKGDTGDIGPQGPRGATGPQGEAGVQGPIGPVGPAGKDGAVGPQGEQGERGPQGLQGVKGETGPAGPQGPRGATGATGAIGPTGPQGPKGEKGDPGTSVDMNNYYNKSQIDTKFKNSVPVPVGAVLTMWNNTNPAELFSGTTWELITAGKYIQSGSIALSTGGSNSVSIAKANLPNVKLKVDSFSLTTQPHTHKLDWNAGYDGGATGPITRSRWGVSGQSSSGVHSSGGQNTGTASPSTESLGSGTALNILPTYITLKFWKRLT